jgi:glycosyltransferase involved in cell wall biosynthesis
MPQSTPTFSVVIPTYNRARLLPKTLDSVFAQRYPHYEVLVVDNCSTDDTEAVLAPLVQAGKLRYIRHDRNYERARSRNTGMREAKGDFLTFLDSDDLMYPDNLADAAAYAQSNPGARFFHNLYELVDAGGKRLHSYQFPDIGDARRAIMEGNFLSCIGVFLHRELYGDPAIRFDEDRALTGSEDWHFWMRVIARQAPGRIPRINNAIVHHAGRTVVAVDLKAVRQRLDLVAAKVEAEPVMRAAYAPYLDRLHLGSLVYLASVANSAHHFKAALLLLLEAVKADYRVLFWQRFFRVLRIAAFRIDKGS